MRLDEFDYELPPELVAQEPAAERDAARLLVHRREANDTAHLHVRDLPELLAEGDLLVLNDTRVRPQRLYGRRRSGGRVELLLLDEEPGGSGRWSAMVNPARKLKPGEVVELEGGALVARMLERPAASAVRPADLRDRERGASGAPAPVWRLELLRGADRAPAGASELERHGHVPLPPYVRRPRVPGADARDGLDRERYQTVFAREPGAVAAPTAGLHFSARLLERLAARGVERTFVTLHVGPGTFRPVKTERVEEHVMHSERYVLGADAARAVAAARARRGRVVAVGTTSVRVLESRAGEDGRVEPGAGATDLFLVPGARFRAVDALLTNFHLPRSTLLMLVCAFAGRERVLELYREAVERRYRFYSYGDAMLLL